MSTPLAAAGAGATATATSATALLALASTPQFHRNVLSRNCPLSSLNCSSIASSIFNRRFHHYGRRSLLNPPHSSVISQGGSSSTFDPELRTVLELATDSELYELERILFGPSYFSPLLKSITKRRADNDYVMIGEDLEERDDYISMLESRFLFLAADARSTLRGWRPSYRNVLLSVRRKLNIPCSAKLPTEGLEVEIFLHLLQEYSSEESEIFASSDARLNTSDGQASLENGINRWKVQTDTALRVGVAEFRSMILKGGGMLTLGKIFDVLARKLSGKMFLEAANYQLKKEVARKAGHVAAINLESRLALLAAKRGLAGAASQYIGVRSMATLLGPVLWGTLLADVVIQMLGTDYARIVRAIYAFAQIRISRTYKLSSDFN